MSDRKETAVRIPELDGVRGIACLMVLLWHYFGAPLLLSTASTPGPWNTLITKLGSIGLSGVDLFFVLSGFLISGILFEHRESPRYFRTFFARRVCRIFPLYFLVFFGLIAALAVGLPRTFPAANDWLFKDLMPLWSYPTFTQNFFMSAAKQAGGKWIAMTWSVAVEEQFYLIFPFIVYFVPMRYLRYGVLLALVSAPVLRQFATAGGLWFYTLLPCRVDCLAAGVLASIVCREPAIRVYLRFDRGLVYATLAVTAVGMTFLSEGVLWYTWLALFYAAAIVLVVCSNETYVAAACRWSPLRSLGLISYGVYMYHQPIQGLFHAALRNQVPTLAGWADVATTTGAAAATLAVSLASYHLLEKRLLRLGHRCKWWPTEASTQPLPSLAYRRAA